MPGLLIGKLTIYLVTRSNDEIALLSNSSRGKSPWGEFSSCSEETCRAWKTRGNQCSRSGPRALFLNCTVECKRSLGAKKFKFSKKMFSQDYQVGYFLYVVTVSPKLFKSFSNWISSLELHRRNTNYASLKLTTIFNVFELY